MFDYETLFTQLPGGRVLDVATGRGNFAESLLENMSELTELTGIDISPKAIQAASQAVVNDKVRFIEMDGACMDFPDAYFDTVCISNSLHHLPDPVAVLREMARVLRPGGKLVISEMVRDGLAATQQTHAELHHWWGRVDTSLGITHNETYTRQEMVDMAQRLGLARLDTYDYSDTSADPKDPDMMKEVEGIIDMYQQRAAGLPEETALRQQGEGLRQRLREIGLHWANALIVVGEK